MNIIKPKFLKSGDTVAIVAPSGALDKEKFLVGIRNFESLGFKTIYSDRIFDKKRYLAGQDENKIQELEYYFEDTKIDGIICARGGYGAIRLIKNINYDIIRQNPKFFGGYSDITALQLMFLKHAGLVTYTSPMIQSDFGCDVVSDFTVKSFINCENNPVIDCENIVPGNVEAVLWGGNLSTIVSMCGVDFLPDEDFIFFAEDISEPVYKIDKMFRQLLNIDVFRKNVKGIIFGEFSNVDNNEYLKDFIIEISQELGVPSVQNLKITHSADKLTLPIGGFAKIYDSKLFL